MNKGDDKRGLSGIVVSILLILLALVAVVVVWVLVSGFMNRTAQGVTITQFTNNIQVDDAKIGLYAAKIKITRTTGDANITVLRFIFNDGTNIYQYDQANNLPQQRESRTYDIPLGNGTKTSATIKVIPIFGKTIGIENQIIPTTDLTTATNTGLVAYWKFDGDAKDYSGDELDGKIGGLTNYVDGKIGTAINLQTTNLTTTVTNVLNTDNHTIIFWIDFTQINDNPWRRIFSYTPTGTDRSPGIWTNPNSSQLHWRYGPGNTGYCNACGINGDYTSNFSIGQWYFIAGTKKDAVFTFYVNGDKKGNGIVANPKIPGSSAIFLGGGSSGGSNYLPAFTLIDELMIFNRTLSDQEVQQIYLSQK